MKKYLGKVFHFFEWVQIIIKVETWDDLQIRASAWTKYMKTHPNASEKKQEAFLNNWYRCGK